MFQRKHLFLICIFLFSLNACATLKEIIKEPEIAFKDVVPQDLSLTEGTFLFNFNVSNPNALGIKLSKISYNLRLNEKDFIKDSLEKGISIPAKGNAVMSVPITVRYTDLYSSLSEVLTTDAVNYALNGTVGVGPFSIPYKHQGELKLPKLPDISLKDISVEKLSLDGASLKVMLGLKNPNDFDINLNGINYAIKLQDKEFAKGLAQNLSPLTANGESLMNLDLKVSFKELGRSAMFIIKGAGAKYEIKGDLLVNTPGQNNKRVPFLKSGEVPLK